MTTLLKDKRVKACKEHRCSFCQGTIKVGEEYLYQVLEDSKEFWTWKQCDFCSEVLDKLYEPGGEYCEGQCGDLLEDAGEEEVRESLAGEYLARALKMMEVTE